MSKFIRETSMTLFDDKLVHCSIGTYAQVNFDFEHCWEIRKKYRPHTLTMIHVHPDNCLYMSTIGKVNDRNMVKGWAQAFGIPIIFIIISKDAAFDASKRYDWRLVKYVVKLENNKPVIYETLSFPDIDKIAIVGPLKYLTEASTNSWLNNVNFNRLKKKVNKRIEISKILL